MSAPAPALHDVQIPPADPDAVKPWRKRLTGLEESERGGRICLGPWLDPGSAWRLPAGALIVGVDRVGDASHRLRLWRVGGDGALIAVRDSTFKTFSSVFGDSVRRTLRTNLDKHPPYMAVPAVLVAAAPARVNEREQACAGCGYLVAAGAGSLTSSAVGSGRTAWQVRHLDGQCVTPWPNEESGPCLICGQTVEAGSGLMKPNSAGAAAPAHSGGCPPRPAAAVQPPGPRRNQRDAACSRCAQNVPAGAGILSQVVGGYEVRHDGLCPPYPGYDGPTWTIQAGSPGRYEPVPGRHWKHGQVVRAVALSWEDLVPDDAPGRVLTRGGTSFVGVVIAEHDPLYCRDEDGDNPSVLVGENGWWHRARVRPATESEAEATLTAEGARAAAAHLAARVRTLLSPGPGADAVRPDAAELAALLDGVDLVEIPTDEPTSHRFGNPNPDRRLTAEGWPHVLVARYNSADGDDWSASNWNGYTAWLLPLTAERAALIQDLRARFDTGNEHPDEPR